MSKRLDVGCPVRAPRPASQKEQAAIQEVRDMQAAIGRQLGSRQDPTTQDMMAVLGSDWGTKLQVYQDAVNGLYQGVDV